MFSEKVAVVVAPATSVKATVNPPQPSAVVGVPAMVAPVRVSPAGRVPSLTVQVPGR